MRRLDHARVTLKIRLASISPRDTSSIRTPSLPSPAVEKIEFRCPSRCCDISKRTESFVELTEFETFAGRCTRQSY